MMNNIIKIDLSPLSPHLRFSMSVDEACATDRELLVALRHGCPEPEVCHLMARVLRPGDYAIDGGANIGFFTLLMSKLVGSKGHVLAFEPGQNNTCKLEDNVEINHCTNVEVVKAPLWNVPIKVNLYMCEDGSKNSLSAHAGTRGVEVLESVILDGYASADMLKAIRLIKLDTEGAELAALKGGDTFLGVCPYIVMELNADALPKFGTNIEGIRDFMRGNGYQMFLLHPNGALPTYVPRQTRVQPSRLNWNVLFASYESVSQAWPEIVA